MPLVVVAPAAADTALLGLCVVWVVIAALAACIGATGARTGTYGKPTVGKGGPVRRGGGCAGCFAPLDQLDAGAWRWLPRLPKRMFWLFYALGAPLSSFSIILVLVLARPELAAAAVVVPCALALHCWRRLAEHSLAGDVRLDDVAAALTTGADAGRGATMGPVVYLGGLGFYLLAPLTAAAAGTRIGVGAAVAADGTSTLALYVVAAAELLQAWAHWHLRGLRAAPGPRYKLPSAGPFACCVCPHYLAEAAFYWALAWYCLAAQPAGAPHLAAAALAAAALWTTANLCVTGRRTLTWYRDTFGSGPVGSRGVMAPFL